MQNRLDFSHNWNKKLSLDAFHTLRLSGRHNVGDIVNVYLNDRLLGSAKCLDKQRYDAAQIPAPICLLDTGYGLAETLSVLAKMYPGQDLTALPMFGYVFRWCSVTSEQKQLLGAGQLSLAL